MKPIWIHLLGWFGLLVLAFVNGTLREAVYRRWMNEGSASALSSFIGVALFAALAATLHQWRPLPNATQAWTVGGLWVLATVVFEFGFGRLRGLGWDKLLGMYNPATGSLWLGVIIATVTLPPLFQWLGRLP